MYASHDYTWSPTLRRQERLCYKYLNILGLILVMSFCKSLWCRVSYQIIVVQSGLTYKGVDLARNIKHGWTSILECAFLTFEVKFLRGLHDFWLSAYLKLCISKSIWKYFIVRRIWHAHHNRGTYKCLIFTFIHHCQCHLPLGVQSQFFSKKIFR